MTPHYRRDVAKGLQNDEYLINSRFARRCYSIRLRKFIF
jgi:hypothetical protein